MIKISLKGLAAFMAADSAQQRSILRRYKFASPERNAMTLYYRPAISAISGFHSGRLSRADLIARGFSLDHDALVLSDRRKAGRCRHNARAIAQYVGMLGRNVDRLLPRRERLMLQRGSVRVTATPDLVLEGPRGAKFVKLWLSKNGPSGIESNVLVQGLYEAVRHRHGHLRPGNIEIVDVGRNCRIRGARTRSRVSAQIDAALINIEAIWPTITPPTRRT